ncbi:MAG: SH3 domain-containing protein [Clostridia bacterium]|nr:SH3 domain-containing protein [Clostridia bacterium]
MKYSTNRTSKARGILTVLLAAVVLAGIIWLLADDGRADTAQAWVICQPGDYVNVREKASIRSGAVGRLDPGDKIEITGEGKNGFAEVTDLTLETGGSAWVYSGYIVFDEPDLYMDEMEVIGTARVAARKNSCGEVRCWLEPGTVVQVFWKTEEWCVTNRGFIMTKFLEVGSV